jgi:peptidoglycan hydrolase-like protein with peptidoglycan-binding domain
VGQAAGRPYLPAAHARRGVDRVGGVARSELDPGAAALAVDGDYGPKTRAMVVAFQRWGGVAADGIVGLQTWAVSLHAAGQELADQVGV